MNILEHAVSQYYKNISDSIIGIEQYIETDLLREVMEYIVPPIPTDATIPQNFLTYIQPEASINQDAIKREIAKSILMRIHTTLKKFWISNIKIVPNNTKYKIVVYYYPLETVTATEINSLREIIAYYFIYTHKTPTGFVHSVMINNTPQRYNFVITDNYFWSRLIKFRYPVDSIENYIELVELPQVVINNKKYIKAVPIINSVFLVRNKIFGLSNDGMYIKLYDNNVYSNAIQIYNTLIYTSKAELQNEKRYYYFYDYLLLRFNTLRLDTSAGITQQIKRANTSTREYEIITTNTTQTLQTRSITVQNDKINIKNNLTLTITRNAIDSENEAQTFGFLLCNETPLGLYFPTDTILENIINLQNPAVIFAPIPMVLVNYTSPTGIQANNTTELKVYFQLEM